jgi:hypothetical protein
VDLIRRDSPTRFLNAQDQLQDPAGHVLVLRLYPSLVLVSHDRSHSILSALCGVQNHLLIFPRLFEADSSLETSAHSNHHLSKRGCVRLGAG